MEMPSSTAIVLAGGRSERLGGADKAMVAIEGATLLDRALGAASAADHIVVVGPSRPTTIPVTRWVEEDPSDGGPAAAFAAGVAAAPPTDVLVLLAVDLPFVSDAIPPLLAALEPGIDVAILADETGRANYLASAWRRDAAAGRLAMIPDISGFSMRKLLDGLTVAHVRDTGGWGFDCDTWDAVERARSRGATRTA